MVVVCLEETLAHVSWARENQLPIFLEYKTYRWLEHCGPNDDDGLGYRPTGELETWKLQDPLWVLRECLVVNHSVSLTELNKIDFVEITWHGMLQGDMKNKEVRIHPTQKPVKLYEWLLDNYAKEGDRILDTHLGSGSIALACHNRGFSLDGYEVDEDYIVAAKKRLHQHQQQLTIF